MHDACAPVRLGHQQDRDLLSTSFHSTLSESPASDKSFKKGREYSRHSERKQTDVTLCGRLVLLSASPGRRCTFKIRTYVRFTDIYIKSIIYSTIYSTRDIIFLNLFYSNKLKQS